MDYPEPEMSLATWIGLDLVRTLDDWLQLSSTDVIGSGWFSKHILCNVVVGILYYLGENAGMVLLYRVQKHVVTKLKSR